MPQIAGRCQVLVVGVESGLCLRGQIGFGGASGHQVYLSRCYSMPLFARPKVNEAITLASCCRGKQA
jgi:hypothetical protein